jgi:hypothetical protein
MGQSVGELVGDPLLLGKGGKLAIKGAVKAGEVLGPKAAEMADKYIGRLGLKLYAAPEEYRGSHTAPSKGKESAPLHELNKIYPDDIYSSKAAQYYGHYGQNDPEDLKAIALMQAAKSNPNMDVTIYRAVPYEKTIPEQVNQLEKQMAAYLRRGNVPKDSALQGSAWYENATRMKERLMSVEQLQQPEKLVINPNDWVTLNRNYAKEHGEGALNGNYKIISMKVKAKDIYTDGNSIQEFGYDPAPKEQK